MKHNLEADGIHLTFDRRQILTDIHFKCETGSIVGMLGRNGQGKSCLMNIVYGSLKVSGKSIRFDDYPVYEAFKRPDLLTYLPQFNFIPASLRLKRVFKDFSISFQEFADYFPEFEGKQSHKINHLSGGLRRLVEVYVIIKSRSWFSMLDEPFSHLMPLQIDRIKNVMESEKQRKGFFITDHLYQQIIDFCDNLYLLSHGKTHVVKTIEDIELLGYAKI